MNAPTFRYTTEAQLISALKQGAIIQQHDFNGVLRVIGSSLEIKHGLIDVQVFNAVKSQLQPTNGRNPDCNYFVMNQEGE